MKRLILNLVVGIACLPLCSLIADDCVFFSPQIIGVHLEGYDEQEQEAIEKDLQVVRSICLPDLQEKEEQKKPVYLP